MSNQSIIFNGPCNETLIILNGSYFMILFLFFKNNLLLKISSFQLEYSIKKILKAWRKSSSFHENLQYVILFQIKDTCYSYFSMQPTRGKVSIHQSNHAVFFLKNKKIKIIYTLVMTQVSNITDSLEEKTR